MPVFLRLTFALLFVSLAAMPASAQDAAPSPEAENPAADEAAAAPSPEAEKPAADEAAAASTGPAKEEFDRIFAQWKELLKDLRNVRQEYRDAKTMQRPEIKKRYDELVRKGDGLEPQLKEAAVAAYGEAPGADPELARLLAGVVTLSCATDDYEPAWQAAQALIEGGSPPTVVYAFAGLAALATERFDMAEKYLGKAEQEGVLEDALSSLGNHWFANFALQYRDLIPYYKDAWAREKKLRAAEAAADDLPRVLLSTSKGDIVVELLENESPNTVANFVSLVDKGFYNGLTFHRVLPGFMAQGGCPDGTGAGGPGYNIPCECHDPDRRCHFRGSLSMAHAGRDTGGSQFFLTFVPTQHLDGQHTVFGRVIEGIEVLARLQRIDPQAPGEAEPDRIVEAKVLRKRDHDYVPKKAGE